MSELFEHIEKIRRSEGKVLDPRYGRLLALAYFADIADALDWRAWRPRNWLRAFPAII